MQSRFASISNAVLSAICRTSGDAPCYGKLWESYAGEDAHSAIFCIISLAKSHTRMYGERAVACVTTHSYGSDPLWERVAGVEGRSEGSRRRPVADVSRCMPASGGLRRALGNQKEHVSCHFSVLGTHLWYQ